MSNPITLKINGKERRITVRPADTLLYALRLRLGLTGSKPRLLKWRLRRLHGINRWRTDEILFDACSRR